MRPVGLHRGLLTRLNRLSPNFTGTPAGAALLVLLIDSRLRLPEWKSSRSKARWWTEQDRCLLSLTRFGRVNERLLGADEATDIWRVVADVAISDTWITILAKKEMSIKSFSLACSAVYIGVIKLKCQWKDVFQLGCRSHGAFLSRIHTHI